MILVCPSCSTSYLTEVQFPPEGRKVRCAKCSHVWRAMPDDDATLVQEPPPEPVAEEPSTDQQPAESADAAPEEERQPEPAAEEPSTDEEPAESADEAPDEEAQQAAADEHLEADEPSSPPTDEQPDESDVPSDTAAELEDDHDIVFDELEHPKVEAEPPPAEAAEAEPAVDDRPEPSDEAELDAVDDASEAEDDAEIDAIASGEPDEPSEAVDAEWPVDEEPDAAPTGIATTQIEPESTGIAVNPTAVTATPTGPVLDATAEEVFVASDRGPKLRSGTGLAMAWVALVLVIGCASLAAYVFRFDIVRAMPSVAQAYRSVGIPVNTRGLEIRDLAYSWEVESTRAVLIVQGQVVNITNEPLEVPQLVLALRDQELANLREIPANVGLRTPLQPGAEAQFRVRILAPPETTSNVFVRFAEAR